jgi:N6-adenosine-specific RNA methylase IME4
METFSKPLIEPSDITIDPEFAELIPRLTPEEYAGLEASLLREGCRQAIVVWCQVHETPDGEVRHDPPVILDGHNRVGICRAHDLPFPIREIDVLTGGPETRDEAKVWIIKHALSQRNLATFQKIELTDALMNILRAQAKANQGTRTDLCQNSDKGPEAVDVKKEVAAAAGVSHDTASRALRIKEAHTRGDVPDEDVQALRNNETSINRVYNELRKREQEREQAALPHVAPPAGKYRTIVIDPPWPIKKIERDELPQGAIDYPVMPLEKIRDMELPLDDGAHVYLWTTQRFLPDALEILESWGLKYIFTMTWHKPGGFQPFGLPQYNSEFVLFGRKGALKFEDTKDFFTCFAAPRREHSRKPDAFYELVRRVSPAPRLDMFSREPREGFEQWGKETEAFPSVA